MSSESHNSLPQFARSMNPITELKELPPDALSHLNDLRNKVYHLEHSIFDSEDVTRERARECHDHLRQLDGLTDRVEQLSSRTQFLRNELLQASTIIARKDAEMRRVLNEHDRHVHVLCEQFNREVEMLKTEIQIWFRLCLDARHPVSLTSPIFNNQSTSFYNMHEVPTFSEDHAAGAGPSRTIE
ncbi:hypothetical protein CsatB_019469 [Cannabis sativa]